jgi:hypothetical protein
MLCSAPNENTGYVFGAGPSLKSRNIEIFLAFVEHEVPQTSYTDRVISQLISFQLLTSYILFL